MTVRQLEEIDALWREYYEECEDIAVQCAKEGYPSHGTNYELRCAQVYQWYREQEYSIMNRGK